MLYLYSLIWYKKYVRSIAGYMLMYMYMYFFSLKHEIIVFYGL